MDLARSHVLVCGGTGCRSCKSKIVQDKLESIVKALNNPKKEKVDKPKKAKRDPYFDECELAIRQELGRKASINVKKGNKGTLEIEFFSKEDLQSILETLAKW